MDQALGPVSGPAIDWSAAVVRALARARRTGGRSGWHGRHAAARGAERRSRARRCASSPQQALPAGEPYERYIFETRQLSRRATTCTTSSTACAGCDCRLPSSAERAAGGARSRAAGAGAARGPVRDAITVFDENGALLHAPPALWEALLAREWRRLFVDLRPLWRAGPADRVRPCAAGKAGAAAQGTHGACLARGCPARRPWTAVDRWLAAQLTAEPLAAKPFTPLPRAGHPGLVAGEPELFLL